MKTRLVVALVALSAATVEAQGLLNFANLADGVDAPVSFDHNNVSGFFAELFYGPEGCPECLMQIRSSNMYDSGQFLKFGYFQGGTNRIEGFLPGQTITAQVRVWDYWVATTWEKATQVAGPINKIGASMVFNVTLSGPDEPPQNVTGLKPFNLRWNEHANPLPLVSVRLFQTNTLVFEWGVDVFTRFVLQQNSTLDPGKWVTLTNVPWTDWYKSQVAVAKPSTQTFYRLVSVD
jgi:hypothetical protein